MHPNSRSNSHKKSRSHHRPSMAAKHKKSKERRCRNNIATFLDLIGFQDDHPTVTTELLLQKLRQIKEKQSNQIKEKQSTAVIKHSRTTRVTFKFDGKVSRIIQQDPKTVLEPPHFDDHILPDGGNKIEVTIIETDDSRKFVQELENPNILDDQMVMNVDDDDHGIIEEQVDDGGNKIEEVMIAEETNDSRKVVPELENPNLDDQMVMNEDDADHGIIEEQVNDDGVREFLMDFIRNIGGSSESMVLVIEKRLTKTDINFKQGRLLMPISKDKYQDFLTALEKEKLNGEEDMKVWVYDPEFRKSVLNLRLWKMKQQYLVLKTQWNKVVTANKLKENMVMQVWSFRVDEQLCFALVRADR